MTSVPDKCTSAMKALDDANFKVKQVLVKVSATTIDESPASTGGGSSSLINLGPAPAAGTSGPSHSNYLYVFYLD